MGEKILILDDDDDLLEVLAILLCDSGYEVLALHNGLKIFDSIAKFHPDLILMDVMLADMDGRTICNRIKQQRDIHKLPIILISSITEFSQSLHQKGAPDDFLAKPFELGHLLGKIQKQLAA